MSYDLYHFTDLGMTKDQLIEKYKDQDEHPHYTREKISAIRVGIKPTDYWYEVVRQLEKEQDELDSCNPYIKMSNESD